jgi:indole-3-glycerol phosphate synthase/phosphoribosylanthranilate isomerase
MAGADAILLIKKILHMKEFEKLLNYANKLSMDVLVEVDCLEDFVSIEHLNFKLCGINNRNLSDFSIDYHKTLELSPYIQSRGRMVISESGIRNRQDILKLRGNIDGCLIGQALIKEPHLLKNLKVYKNRIKVKICGIKNIKDALAIDGKADYIGLILCDSKRKISLKDAISIRSGIENSYLVGVFSHQSPEFIENCFKVLKLDYVQVDKDIELLAIEEHKIIRAISYHELPILNAINLIDSKSPGSGKVFDLKYLKSFNNHPYILAGGLNVKNLKQRVLNSNCFAVDVSSGVEKKDRKSTSLMLDFIQKVGEL